METSTVLLVSNIAHPATFVKSFLLFLLAACRLRSQNVDDGTTDAWLASLSKTMALSHKGG
jgi:hypothetical protein